MPNIQSGATGTLKIINISITKVFDLNNYNYLCRKI